MNYAVVRTDKMFGTDVRSGLVSIKYITEELQNDATVKVENDIENGNVLKVGPLMEGEREIYEGSAVAADDNLKEIVLVASPEIVYDEHLHNLSDFINKAGKPARGYYLHNGDIFSVTAEALDGEGEPAVGDIVELKAGTKLHFAGSATASTTQVGKIIAIDTVGVYTYYVILVVEAPVAG